MRIVVVGQAAFGAKILECLAQKGEDVVAAFCPAGKRGDPVKEAAQKLGIAAYQVATMKDPQVYPDYCHLRPDLGVMAFVTDIVPVKVLDCPRLGTIQYHPSLLPKHRGGSAINWPIIRGETRTGITIFWPDKGIDTGPILMQKEVDISPDDTVGLLYFNKLFPIGVEALVEAVNLVRQGIAPRIPQDESRATYEGLCGEGEARIDWSQSSRRVYDLIRGTNPQPGAYTYWQDKPVKVFDSELCTSGERGKPGQVLDIGAAGIKIATCDGAILVKQVQPESARKMEAVAYVKSVNLGTGAILGAHSGGFHTLS